MYAAAANDDQPCSGNSFSRIFPLHVVEIDISYFITLSKTITIQEIVYLAFFCHPDSLFSGNWFTNVVRAYVCYSGCHKSRIINSISEVISQNRKLKYVNKQSSDHILQLRGFISQGKFGKNSKNRS